MAYSIGQYHSKPANIQIESNNGEQGASKLRYVENMNDKIVDNNDRADGIQAVEVQGILTETSEHDSQSITFRDNAIILSDSLNFVKNEDYYFEIDIKRDIGYDIKYDIRLVKFKENDKEDKENIKYLYNETGMYQQLKRVIVEKGSVSLDGLNTDVVVYYDSNFNKRVVLLEDINLNEDETLETKYSYTNNNGKVYLPQRGIVNTSAWLDEDTSKSASKKICIAFRPYTDDFNGIIIKKEIETIDYQLSFVENGKSFQGIKTEVSNPRLYKLRNIINKGGNNENDLNIPNNNTIKKIGIWGRSGLGFMINGEEIHIGSRGYYELDIDDMPIKTICPIVLDDNDRFLIDYEYQKEG